MCAGARSRNRTGTPFRARDFKSRVSTSFTIRAAGEILAQALWRARQDGVAFVALHIQGPELNITINEELRSFIDPLTANEYAALERSLLAEGCRDALVLWGEVLIAGLGLLGLMKRRRA